MDLRFYTQYILQKLTLDFTYLHLDGVSSSTHSLQIKKYLQCLIPYLSTKLGKKILMQKIINWSWKDKTCIKNHVKPCTTLIDLNQCNLKMNSYVESKQTGSCKNCTPKVSSDQQNNLWAWSFAHHPH